MVSSLIKIVCWKCSKIILVLSFNNFFMKELKDLVGFVTEKAKNRDNCYVVINYCYYNFMRIFAILNGVVAVNNMYGYLLDNYTNILSCVKSTPDRYQSFVFEVYEKQDKNGRNESVLVKVVTIEAKQLLLYLETGIEDVKKVTRALFDSIKAEIEHQVLEIKKDLKKTLDIYLNEISVENSSLNVDNNDESGSYGLFDPDQKAIKPVFRTHKRRRLLRWFK